MGKRNFKKLPLVSLVLALVLLLSMALSACGLLTEVAGTATSQATPASANTPVAGTTSGNASTTTVAAAPLAATTTAAVASNQPVPLTGNLETDVKSVVKSVMPSVVLVAVNTTTQDMFGRTQQAQGVGTGSIITPDGYIVTNNHVVEGAQNIRVGLSDGRKFDAKLIGTEPNNDIAVIKIEGQNLPTIKIGDSSKLEIGDWVIAIGNALGLEGGSSVTSGIISALGRSISEENGVPLTDLIQTDAAINPGNSGGPLVNLRGEMVGINTAAATGSGSGAQAQNIGFAISYNQVKPLVDGFISGKPVSRPYMGVNITNVTSIVATRYNLPTDIGVLITSVAANSPAAKAGWKAGDIIVQMDNQPIKDTTDLSKFLLTKKPNDSASVKLISAQGGGSRTTQITFGQRPTS